MTKTIKAEVIVRLLESLSVQVDLLRTQQAFTLRELTADLVRWNGILHLLQLCVEHVTDIGAHLIAGTVAGAPEDYRQTIQQMGRTGILPFEFAQRIASMATFRNIIVHRYLTVDPEKVAEILFHQLSDFDDFSVHILDYLRREGLLPAE